MSKRTVDELFKDTELTLEDVAERAKLTEDRIEAIAMGRWTPSPQERLKVAEAFGVSIEEVIWGHTLDPRNIRYRFGRREDS